MRLTSVTFRGITCFTDPSPIHVELDELGGGLVALVGANGAGKTTFLSAVPASLYRMMPDRAGSLYEHSHGRDAFIETKFDDDGHELKVRLQIDVEARRIEHYVFEDGVSLTTGRAAEAQTAIEKRFGSVDLLLASVFASQSKAGDFLRMSKRDRKALMIELLGLSYLEALHGDAKDRRAGALNELAVARSMVDALEREVAELDDRRQVLAAAAERVSSYETGAQAARVVVESARARLDDAERSSRELGDREKAMNAAHRELELAKTAHENANGLAARAELTAQQRHMALEDPSVLEIRALERRDTALKNLDRRAASLDESVALAPRVEEAKRELEALEDEALRLAAAEKRHGELVAGDTIAEVELGLTKQALAAERERRDAERERLGRQASLLDSVPCTLRARWISPMDSSEVPLAKMCPLLEDARQSTDALARLDEEALDGSAVGRAEAKYDEARNAADEALSLCDALRLTEIQEALPAVRELAGKGGQVEIAQRDREAIDSERELVHESYGKELRGAAAAQKRFTEMRQQIDVDLRAALAEAKEATAEAASTYSRERYLELEAALDEARKSVADVETARLQYESAQSACAAVESELKVAYLEHARIEAEVEQLEKKAGELEKHRADVQGPETELGDWSLLEQALGRDGIQALEIDAAGPEVARLTNELLESCYGSRFSLSFETLREKRSNRGEYSEAFDVRVYHHGHERTAEAISGGERVVIGEAIGLALAIFNARKSGIRWETLFRDETAGALDPENAEAYVEMLRRALVLGGFEQVLFVSHSETVWERADAQLFIDDGRVHVGGPHAEGRVLTEKAAAI